MNMRSKRASVKCKAMRYLFPHVGHLSLDYLTNQTLISQLALTYFFMDTVLACLKGLC